MLNSFDAVSQLVCLAVRIFLALLSRIFSAVDAVSVGRDRSNSLASITCHRLGKVRVDVFWLRLGADHNNNYAVKTRLI